VTDTIPPGGRGERLHGKCAIVTGAGSRGPGVGTGKAISLLLAGQGARVCLVDLHADRADATRAAIERGGGEAFVVEADVSDDADCGRIVDAAVARFGAIDILINNVAIIEGFGPLSTFDEQIWDRTLAVNLKSIVLMCRHALPRMARGGAVVNISSIAALTSAGQTEAYSASKAAMNRLSADLAIGWGRAGIRVNVVAPGMIHTPMVGDRPEATRQLHRKAVPLGVEGDAWDVAWAVVYLASDEARFVSAICLPVDGGITQLNPMKAYELLSE
jgi:NAD(P)-dependent dehydrogenase (short-subunit alcohol dehydrogenase family)